jgi:vacuolar-type H+-ATPase subunit I/STV1
VESNLIEEWWFLIMDKVEELEKEIKELEERLKDREAALPAHSVRPHQLLLIEELETAIEEKKKELEKVREKEAANAGCH